MGHIRLEKFIQLTFGVQGLLGGKSGRGNRIPSSWSLSMKLLFGSNLDSFDYRLLKHRVRSRNHH